MNILYLSKMTGKLWAGPNTSVPMQIVAQSSFDNVFWYNMNHVKLEKWEEMGAVCYNIDDYPTGRLQDLPEPFDKPDIAVVEEFYTFPFSSMIKDLQKMNIPYVIVPRSTMTKQAQRHKRIKKMIGNILWFKKMAARAAAIHFLTKEEKNDCTIKWNDKSFIVPNGIVLPSNNEKNFHVDKINAVYVGRIEIYQKGLDLLCQAIAEKREILRTANFCLTIYGPDRENSRALIEKMIKDMEISDIVFIKDAIFEKEKKQVLLEADVFIMTSRFEGLPMGMLEALSYGVPCFAASGTNMSSRILEYQSGWGSENSCHSIAENLQKMVLERDLLATKSKNAIKLASEYSWQTIAKETHEQYLNIIQSNK